MDKDKEKAIKEYNKLIENSAKYLRQVFDYRDEYMKLHVDLFNKEESDSEEVRELQAMTLKAQEDLRKTHIKLQEWRAKYVQYRDSV